MLNSSHKSMWIILLHQHFSSVCAAQFLLYNLSSHENHMGTSTSCNNFFFKPKPILTYYFSVWPFHCLTAVVSFAVFSSALILCRGLHFFHIKEEKSSVWAFDSCVVNYCCMIMMDWLSCGEEYVFPCVLFYNKAFLCSKRAALIVTWIDFMIFELP